MSAIAKLAQAIAKLQRDVRDLQRAPRLGNSSFEGTLRTYDDEDAARVLYGRLPNGSYGVAALNDGEWKFFPADLGVGGGGGPVLHVSGSASEPPLNGEPFWFRTDLSC